LDYSEYEEHLEEGPVDQELIDAFDEKGHEIADWSDLEELDDDKWTVVNENGGFFTLEKYENRLKIKGEDIPLERAHTASTMLYFELPTDDLPDEATLEISAKNILGAADSQGEIIEYDDGAEASIEIPIKNARPELSLDTDKDTYYTSDYTTSDDGPYIVSPKFDISLDNPAGDNTPKYDITMDIKFDDSSYETLTYFFYRDIDDDISQYITIEVPDGYDGSVSIKFTVETRYERHGGWIETFEISESFDVVEDGRDDSDDGGSGGGTPPPGGVVPTGNETSLEGG